MSSRTTHIRVEKDLVAKWDKFFPGVDRSQIVKMAWNTSLLNVEAHLKEKNFKDKFGKFIYGDSWNEKK